MGQKSSKKADLYVTDDVTHCHLLEDDLKKYVGRPREYTAVDVIVEKPELHDTKDTSPKKKTSPRHPSNSIISLLTKAHRKSYHLAFVVPKVKGGKSTTLGRNSLIKEENDSAGGGESGEADKKEEAKEPTHTVFLLRPKVKSRLKKEFSLKRMEATKTFLNVMMDIGYKWVFSIKDFVDDVSAISSGKYVTKLQEMIKAEAEKGGRLLTVMRIENIVANNQAAQNGATDKDDNTDEEVANNPPDQLRLRMVFLHKTGENVSPLFEYTVASHKTKCTEQRLKVKKKQAAPKSTRSTNVTWREDWLAIFKSDSRLTEVINVGELPTNEAEPEPEQTSKSKKSKKPREFEVSTLCFYEKPIAKASEANDDTEKNDDDDDDDEEEDVTYPDSYDGLVREVWAPIDDNVQENLESEAENLGNQGWELCTVLVTSQVRMKPNGSEFRKCAIFFQRPKKECIPAREMDRSRENLLNDETVAVEASNDPEVELLDDTPVPPTSPKDKVEKFGIAIMKQGDLDLSKLRSTSKSSPKPVKKEENPVISGIAAIQLKKVDRDKLKKTSPADQDQAIAPQVKLRHTDVTNTSEKKGEQKEVPWMASLEKKREAVLKSEDKPKSERPTSGEVEGEIAQRIGEIKEKRAQRINRISLHKEEESKRMSTEQQESVDTAETNEKNNETGKSTSIAATEDANDEDLPALDDLPSPPPVELYLPPPVVTPPNGDETPLSHLHLPSPPPITGDLTPQETEEFNFPPATDQPKQDPDKVQISTVDEILPPPVDEDVQPLPADDVPPKPSDELPSSTNAVLTSVDDEQLPSVEDEQPPSVEDEQPSSVEDEQPSSVEDEQPPSVEDEQPSSTDAATASIDDGDDQSPSVEDISPPTVEGDLPLPVADIPPPEDPSSPADDGDVPLTVVKDLSPPAVDEVPKPTGDLPPTADPPIPTDDIPSPSPEHFPAPPPEVPTEGDVAVYDEEPEKSVAAVTKEDEQNDSTTAQPPAHQETSIDDIIKDAFDDIEQVFGDSTSTEDVTDGQAVNEQQPDQEANEGKVETQYETNDREACEAKNEIDKDLSDGGTGVVQTGENPKPATDEISSENNVESENNNNNVPVIDVSEQKDEVVGEVNENGVAEPTSDDEKGNAQEYEHSNTKNPMDQNDNVKSATENNNAETTGDSATVTIGNVS